MIFHDHNFKNVFLDFPKESLEWIMPEISEKLGQIQQISFVREELQKRKLSDPHLCLDMPILYVFEKGKVLLWLVEFQEDKRQFSIFRLLRYVTDLMEQYSDAILIPTVLFTKRQKWRKYVRQKLESKWGNRRFLHFEYVLIRLFDYKAKDYYNHKNPVVKIFLPKMEYEPEERGEVIRQAYRGLFDLVTPMLFDKYLDFIDIYAGIQEDERDVLYREISEQEDTAMLAQYIKQKGFQEGRHEGRQEGRHEGRQEGRHEGSYKTLSSMLKIMKKNGMSEESIGKMMNLDVNFVRKILNGEQVDIPVNLL